MLLILEVWKSVREKLFTFYVASLSLAHVSLGITEILVHPSYPTLYTWQAFLLKGNFIHYHKPQGRYQIKGSTYQAYWRETKKFKCLCSTCTCLNYIFPYPDNVATYCTICRLFSSMGAFCKVPFGLGAINIV